MTDIEMDYHPDLAAVLRALGIHWRRLAGGAVLVSLDAAADGRLEALIGGLAALRWRYKPGRAMQLEMELSSELRGGDPC